MTSGRKTTYGDRVEIVSFCIENNDNYQLAAESIRFPINRFIPGQRSIRKAARKRLPTDVANEKTWERTDAEKLAAQVRLLEAENKRLQLEVGFLKKLEEVERKRTGKTNI